MAGYPRGSRFVWGERLNRTVPVIRAAALVPLLRRLVANGRPVEAMLRRAGLGYVWFDNPFAVVPIRALERFLIEVTALEGPDFGARCIETQSLPDLAAIGMVLLTGRTPRESLSRVVTALPHHCSHEIISLVREAEETELRDYWNLRLDPEAEHMIQQIVAALAQALLWIARPDEPVMRQVEIRAHPRFGLDHLRPLLRCDLIAASRPLLTVRIPNDVLDTPFRPGIRPSPPQEDWQAWARLTDLSMAGSIRQILHAAMREGTPNVQQVAAIADMSVRSLQRRLAEEGVAFSDLVEQVRRDMAMEALAGTGLSLGEVAANLGYSKQSSLTRAFRRWVGHPPSALRTPPAGQPDK